MGLRVSQGSFSTFFSRSVRQPLHTIFPSYVRNENLSNFQFRMSFPQSSQTSVNGSSRSNARRVSRSALGGMLRMSSLSHTPAGLSTPRCRFLFPRVCHRANRLGPGPPIGFSAGPRGAGGRAAGRPGCPAEGQGDGRAPSRAAEGPGSRRNQRASPSACPTAGPSWGLLEAQGDGRQLLPVGVCSFFCRT